MRRVYSGINDLIEKNGVFYVSTSLFGVATPGDHMNALGRCLAEANRSKRADVDKFKKAFIVKSGIRRGLLVRICEESVMDFEQTIPTSKHHREVLNLLKRCLNDVHTLQGQLQEGATDVLALAERDILFYNQWQDAKKALTAKDDKIKQLEEELTEKTKKIKQLEEELTEKTKKIKQKAEQIGRAEVIIERYREIIASKADTKIFPLFRPSNELRTTVKK